MRAKIFKPRPPIRPFYPKTCTPVGTNQASWNVYVRRGTFRPYFCSQAAITLRLVPEEYYYSYISDKK